MEMNIVIMKFGGTSLSTQERRLMVTDKITASRAKGNAVVVVVSAMGRKGDPYATDSLRNIVISSYPDCSLKHLDLLMSCGEIISSVVLTAALESMGHKAVALTGRQAGIITDNTFSNAEILSIDESKIIQFLENDMIVVVAGFQGTTEQGEITTLGRGGSDTTAAALGVALEASCIEIYTDVDGIMTADPNIVPSAKIIDEINYNEVFQMAEKGAKVIHPRAVEIAQNGNIPLKIKNTLSTHPGTCIYYFHKNGESVYSTKQKEKLLRAVTHKDHIAQVTLHLEDTLEEESRLLNALAKAHISIDMINFFIDKKVFTINEDQSSPLQAILDHFNLNYSLMKGCSKVTIIGNRITGIPGVMATVVHALAKENIKIFQSSDSHSTISCLVKQEDAKKAVNALHEAFCLNQ
jgi:aspartate kinase